MPQPKGLVEFRGRPWLEWQLERIAACGFKRVIVVLGHRADEYFTGLPWLKSAVSVEVAHAGVAVKSVLNDLPEYGPFSSIQAAGRELDATAFESVFILPVDVPCPDVEVWQALARASGDAILPVLNDRGGHPVRISRGFLLQLLLLAPEDPESRLDVQIHRLSQDLVVRLPVGDPKIGTNLNTLEDWQRWEKSA